MPLRGAAIGPDAVLAWTGERELTRFDRDGSRSSFTIPIPPLASQIGIDGVRVVDARGTIHHYSLTGGHVGATPLHKPFDGVIISAALAADSAHMAIVVENPRYEDSGEASVYANGEAVPWVLAGLVDGYRETGVDLSRDGSRLLVQFRTFTYFTGYTSGGGNGGGVRVLDSQGNLYIDHEDREHEMDDVKLSPGGEYIAWTIAPGVHRWVRFEHEDRESGLVGSGREAHFTFASDLLGAVYPDALEVMQLSTRRCAQLDLPESFAELIFCGDDAVVVHPDLGAWWIPLASLSFEAE